MKRNTVKKAAALFSALFLFCSFLILTVRTAVRTNKSASNSSQNPAASSTAETQTEAAKKTEPTPPSTVPPTTEDTATPVMEMSEKSEQVKDISTAVIGNSLVESLYIYRSIPEADLFYRVGLTVSDVYKKNCVKQDFTAIDALGKKSYDVVILIFGMNEVGWNKGSFISRYSDLIDTVREKQPGARIYIHSITPLTKKVSDQNIDGANNPAIFKFNAALKELAGEKDENVIYLDANPVFSAKSGVMVDGATADGTHPEIKYTRRWATLLRMYIKGEL